MYAQILNITSINTIVEYKNLTQLHLKQTQMSMAWYGNHIITYYKKLYPDLILLWDTEPYYNYIWNNKWLPRDSEVGSTPWYLKYI